MGLFSRYKCPYCRAVYSREDEVERCRFLCYATEEIRNIAEEGKVLVYWRDEDDENEDGIFRFFPVARAIEHDIDSEGHNEGFGLLSAERSPSSVESILRVDSQKIARNCLRAFSISITEAVQYGWRCKQHEWEEYAPESMQSEYAMAIRGLVEEQSPIQQYIEYTSMTQTSAHSVSPDFVVDSISGMRNY